MAIAQPQELPSPPPGDPYVVRAVRAPTSELVSAIAQGAAPIRLDERRYPDAKRLTAGKVIEALCGEVRPEYWMAFLERNTTMGPIDQNAELLDRAYAYEFPACIFSRPRPGYVVRKGDVADDVYEALTGDVGDRKAVEAFFGRTTAELKYLQVGDVLQPSHLTLASRLVIQDQGLQTTLEAAAEKAVEASNPKLKAVAPKVSARILMPRGYVAGAMALKEPAECATAAAPSEATLTRLARAYERAHERLGELSGSRQNVEVMVIDNGYLGATMTSNGLAFRPGFPDWAFSRLYDATIGPGFRLGDPAERVTPWFEPPPGADGAVGHGTHVTSLALGGIGFTPSLKTLMKDGPTSLFLVSHANVGNGGEALLANSSEELRKLAALSGFRIINISLEYQDDASRSVSADFRYLFENAGDTEKVYVVAAGNDSDVVDLIYPATFGGMSSANVITVAAARADGSLADFSNWGEAVDIAAPGCGVLGHSSIDYAKPTRMSGTSQAAPQVSFAAALLRTLGGHRPAVIKARLIASGDLIEAPTAGETNRRDPSAIWSLSRLNVERALYLFDDYVRLADGREYLGRIEALEGLACRLPTSARVAKSLPDLYAFKARGAEAWVFAGRGGAAGALRSPCAWDRSGAAFVVFKPQRRITDAGPQPLGPDDPAKLQPKLSQVTHLVQHTAYAK